MEGARKRLNRLLIDNRMGAVELTMGVSGLLQEIFRESGDERELRDHCMTVIRNGPMMAPLLNLVNGTLLAIEEGGSATDHCSRFSGNLEKSLRSTAENGSSLIKDGMRLLTYSNSSTIIETIGSAVGKGRQMDVILSNAGPVGEGIIMAERIRDLGVPVILVPDGALFQEMDDADLIIVGADSIMHSGLINKIGTRGLASHARLQGKEFIVMAGTEKILPRGLSIFKKKLRDPAEVYRGGSDLRVKNYYFDLTPVYLLSKIVTEKGVMDPVDIRNISGRIPLHPLISRYFGKIN